MDSPLKLRKPGEMPYSPAVPDPLPEDPRSAPKPWALSPECEFLVTEQVDIVATLEAQKHGDDARESIGAAHLAGCGVAVLCIALAGGVAALTGWSGRSFALGIGLCVGLAVQRFGGGKDRRFGCVGAFWALAGCFGGFQLAMAFVLVRQGGMPFLQYLHSVPDWGWWVNEHARWSDLFFYGVAACCSYRLSFNALAEKY